LRQHSSGSLEAFQIIFIPIAQGEQKLNFLAARLFRQ